MKKIILSLLMAIVSTSAFAQVASRTIGVGKSYAESGYNLYDWTKKPDCFTGGYWPGSYPCVTQNALTKSATQSAPMNWNKNLRKTPAIGTSEMYSLSQGLAVLYTDNSFVITLSSPEMCDKHFLNGKFHSPASNLANSVELHQKKSADGTTQHWMTFTMDPNDNPKNSKVQMLLDSNDCITTIRLMNKSFVEKAISYFGSEGFTDFGHYMYEIFYSLNQEMICNKN